MHKQNTVYSNSNFENGFKNMIKTYFRWSDKKMFRMKINQHSVFHEFQNKDFQQKILFPQKLKVAFIFLMSLYVFDFNNVKTDVKKNSTIYHNTTLDLEITLK